MGCKTRCKTTSPRLATKASKALQSKSTSKTTKSLAGSVLSQKTKSTKKK